MKIEDLLAQLGQKMGIALQLDENRACRLVFDDSITVDFEAPEALAGKLMMSCLVAADVRPDERETVFRTLLEANLCGRGTGGAVLAMNDETDEVVLQRILEVRHTDLQDLEVALDQLLQYGEAWSARLANRRPDGPSALEGSTPGISHSMLKV